MDHQTFYKTLDFNQLIIIDCLADDELQSARRLDENIRDSGFRQGVVYLKVKDATEFRQTIQEIKKTISIISEPIVKPIIHIEAHGSPFSLELPDKSTIPWGELAEDLRYVNEVMKNQLILFIGACHGYHFIRNNITITKFAPAYYLIAPFKSIPAVDIENSTHTFYKSLLTTSNVTSSGNLLDDTQFYKFNSDLIFHKTFHELMQQHHRGGEYKNRKESLITTAINELGNTWHGMSNKQKNEYLKKARKLLKTKLTDHGEIRIIFDKYSMQFMGYANELLFNEILKHMKDNKQGQLY